MNTNKKTVIFLTAILLSVSFISKSFAQNEMPSKDGLVLYENIDGSIIATTKELHTRAKIWLADAFRDSKEVIQLDDPEAGTLMGKGNFDFYQALVPFIVRFSVKINSKENKFRIQFYEITIQEGTGGQRKEAEHFNNKKGRDKLKDNINKKFADIIADFNIAMKKKTDNDF